MRGSSISLLLFSLPDKINIFNGVILNSTTNVWLSKPKQPAADTTCAQVSGQVCDETMSLKGKTCRRQSALLNA